MANAGLAAWIGKGSTSGRPSFNRLPTSAALVMCGFGGIAYSAIVMRRARRQTFYKPVWQDWLWYALLPCSIYAVLALAAAFLRTNPRLALPGIGAAALGLLLIGVHNAWDTVIYVALVRREGPEAPEVGAKKRKTKSH